MTDSEDKETPPDVDERDIRKMSDAIYRALQRRDEERMIQEASSPHVEEEPQPLPPAVVLYKYRKSWVVVFNALSIIPMTLVALVLYLVCWIYQPHLRDPSEQPFLSHIPWVADLTFPLLPTVLLVIFIGVRIKNYWRKDLHDLIQWFGETWQIDTREVRRRVNVKGWVGNAIGGVEDVDHGIARNRIIDPSVKQNWVGELFGYCTLNLGSADDEDGDFRHVHYLRHPKKLKEIFGLDQEV